MEILSSITREASNILILFTTEKTGTIKCLGSVNQTRMLAANSENKMAILRTQNYLTKQRENKKDTFANPNILRNEHVRTIQYAKLNQPTRNLIRKSQCCKAV